MAEVTKPILLDETGQAIVEKLNTIAAKMDGVIAEPLSVTENGTYTPETGKAYAPVTVNVEARTEIPMLEAGVNFLDYDGTVIETWTPEETASKTALPAAPNHASDIVWEGVTIPLTSEGWTWSLANIKKYMAEEPQARLDIGHYYHTTDNKLYLCCDIADNYLKLSLNTQAASTSALKKVNWGDGSPEEDTTANSLAHEYASAGKYVITIEVVSSKLTQYNSAIRAYDGTMIDSYLTIIRKVFCPIEGMIRIATTNIESIAQSSLVHNVAQSAYIDSVYIHTSESVQDLFCPIVLIPDTITTLSQPLRGVSLPDCIAIPEGIAVLPQYMFYQGWKRMKYLILPSTLTTINSQAIAPSAAGAKNLQYLKFKSAEPPTISNTNALDGLTTSCKILVPRGTLNAYKAATNYPNPTTYTYEEYD